jgi:hypothetical protein
MEVRESGYLATDYRSTPSLGWGAAPGGVGETQPGAANSGGSPSRWDLRGVPTVP